MAGKRDIKIKKIQHFLGNKGSGSKKYLRKRKLPNDPKEEFLIAFG